MILGQRLAGGRGNEVAGFGGKGLTCISPSYILLLIELYSVLCCIIGYNIGYKIIKNICRFIKRTTSTTSLETV